MDEFEVGVGCRLDEVAVLAQVERGREHEEVEETLEQAGLYAHRGTYLAHDRLAGDPQVVGELVGGGPRPPPKCLTERLLIYLQLATGELLRPRVHQLVAALVYLLDGGEALRVDALAGEEHPR